MSTTLRAEPADAVAADERVLDYDELADPESSAFHAALAGEGSDADALADGVVVKYTGYYRLSRN